jgi:hypothetical protein
MADPKHETWRNTSLGLKWYKCFDIQGRETTKVVRGNGVFTLTTQERQLNQEASIPELDLFRNGTFVLKKAATETDPDEIASPNSLTDAQIESIYNEVTHGEENLVNYLTSIESPVTLQRMLEIFVAEGDSKDSDVKAIRNRMSELNPSAARGDREIITRPEPEDRPTRVSPGGFSVPEGVKVGSG